MANGTSLKERLIGERVRALATMYLTRRSDLHVREVGEDLGYDLIVQIVRGNKSGLRQFGVELRGTRSPVSKDHADNVLRPTLKHLKEYYPFPFPVCVFFFTMDDNQGWYFWAAEPVVSAGGKPTLPLAKAPDCHPLDDAALEEIVQRVDRWFDAFYTNLATKE